MRKIPKNEEANRRSKSFLETRSAGINKDAIQNAQAAKHIRKDDVAKGESHSGIKLFAIGMFNPNISAVKNTAM